MSMVSTQDLIVQDNVARAQEMYEALTKGYNLAVVIDNASTIYISAHRIMRGEVRDSSIVTEMFTPVMIELNKVSPSPLIQHSLIVLTPVLKAHRAAAEITWMMAWRQKQRLIYTPIRDGLITMTEEIKKVLPKSASLERGMLISPSGAHYELSCLRQAAKCFSPTDGIWAQFSDSLLTVGEAAATVAVTETLDFGALMGALRTIASLGRKEWIASWYTELCFLEWQATDIVALDQFRVIIEPKIERFLSTGGKYTLGLVKILTIIFQNEETTPDLKDQVCGLLCGLVTIMPEYTLREALSHPGQILEKLFKKIDRYAHTRSFAAAFLLEMISKPENKKYLVKIGEAFKVWQTRLSDKKYIFEMEEAKKRLSEIQAEMREIETKKREAEEVKEKLEGDFLEATDDARSANAGLLSPDELGDMIDAEEERITVLTQQIASSAKQVTEITQCIEIATELAGKEEAELLLVSQFLEMSDLLKMSGK